MNVRIALAGNPNCGKTTLFNALTGSNQFVGNWPGVTYPFQPCVEVFLGEEAQLAARLVVRDCAAHHHLVEIAWLQSEVTGCFRGGHQITFTFHIRSFLLLLVLS